MVKTSPSNAGGVSLILGQNPTCCVTKKQNIKYKQYCNKFNKNLKKIITCLMGASTILNPFNSVQFSHSVLSDSLGPHGLQHASLPCPLSTPGAYSNSCPLSQLCHPTISSSVVPFSSCLHSFPTSGSFPVSQFFASGSQRIGVSASASVPPMKIQD